MRVLVCGGRDYHDMNYVDEVLSEIQPTVIIEGGARAALTSLQQIGQDRTSARTAEARALK